MKQSEMALLMCFGKPLRMQFLSYTTVRNSFTKFESRKSIHSNVALLKPIAELPKKNGGEDEGSSKKFPILSFLLRRLITDEWNPDSYMQTVIDKNDEKFVALAKENGSLSEKLELANEIIFDLLILANLRYDGEIKMAKYWILTPRTASWRSDMIDLVQKQCGGSPSPTTLLPLIPPPKEKIAYLMDDIFLKWLYILMYSFDPFVVSLRKDVEVIDLINKAQNIAFILTIVRHATHKVVPKTLKIKRPSKEDIKRVLVEDHSVTEEAVDTVFHILQR